MTLSELGSLGEFIGSIGVIVSLIYVGLQIRQNTETTRDLAAQSLTATHSDANALIAESGDLAAILQKGFLTPESLDETEQLLFNAFFFAAYNQFDFAYRRHLAGKLDDESWRKMETEIPTFLHLKGPRAWWEKDKVRFSPKFVTYVDNKLSHYVPPDQIPTMGESRS